MNLEKYKSAWRQHNQNISGTQKLTERDIMNFIEKQSIGISALFRKGLIIDSILKSTVILSFIFLIFMFQENMTVIGFNLLLIVIAGILLLFQFKYYREINAMEDLSGDLRDAIKNKIDYFNRKYVKAIYIGAFSNPLLVTSGMMYYFYHKYGQIRPLDTTDVFVLGSTVFISFVVAAFIQMKQHRFHINQLETCLHDLDEGAIDELTIKKLKNKRLQLILISLIALMFGVLLLLYLAAR